jgi:hypothetical protein
MQTYQSSDFVQEQFYSVTNGPNYDGPFYAEDQIGDGWEQDSVELDYENPESDHLHKALFLDSNHKTYTSNADVQYQNDDLEMEFYQRWWVDDYFANAHYINKHYRSLTRSVYLYSLGWPSQEITRPEP